LPPAILPYWDGDKQSLIDGAKPGKAVSPDDVASRFHNPGILVPQTPQAKYMPDRRVPQGVMREVPMPARELHSTGLLHAPATGIWHGSVDPAHPLAKVFNQWYRQSYVEEGMAFPDPRDRGLDISPKDIQWRWLDQA
ncbi:sel1 repeat family protein, partial [Herbaspirillum frisingense]